MSNVAIIMSLYHKDNLEAFRDSLDSMINQTYKVDIYLFIDGALPVDLDNIVIDYSSLTNVNVIRSPKNLGLASALNSLIEEVLKYDYTYVARMDSDDVSHANRIEKQVKYLNNNENVDVLGTGCVEFGASYALKEKTLPTNHSDLKSFSITRCPFIHPTVMFRSEIFSKGYRYPENTKLTEDMAFWFVLLDSGFTFSNLNDCLLDFRLNENTVNRRRGLSKAISEMNIRFKYMIKLEEVSLRNILLISSRIVFHLLPKPLLKLAYKKAR